MLGKYKFTIYYILKKENSRINIFNYRLDLIKKNKKYIYY